MLVYKSIRDNKKRIFFALAIVLIVHAVKIINYLPTHDSMYGLSLSYTEMIDQGRWLGPLISNFLTTKYDLQWVEGIFIALFIALTIHFILEIFPLKNKRAEIIAISLFAVFPSTTAFFQYEFWFAATTFALLLSTLTIYIVLNVSNKGGLLIAVILLTVSLGIYQQFIAFSASMILFWASSSLILKNKNFKEVLNYMARFAIVAVCSLLLYWCITKIVLAVFNIEITTYQGMSSIGIMTVQEYLNACISFVKSFITFFVPVTGFTIYGALNAIFAILIIILVLVKVAFNKNYTVANRILIILLSCLGIVATYIFYFVSSGVHYHAVMEFGNYFIYLFGIVLALNKTNSIKVNKYLCCSCLVVVSLITVFNFQNANITYKQQEIRLSRTNFEVSEILTWIDEINEDNLTEIAIIGSFEKNNDVAQPMLNIVGARSDNFLTHPYHFVRFAEYYYGRKYSECSEERLRTILDSDEYLKMESYPNKKCVAIINNTVVLKLTE